MNNYEKIKFYYYSNTTKETPDYGIVLSGEAMTWNPIFKNFLIFMKGLGYIFSDGFEADFMELMDKYTHVENLNNSVSVETIGIPCMVDEEEDDRVEVEYAPRKVLYCEACDEPFKIKHSSIVSKDGETVIIKCTHCGVGNEVDSVIDLFVPDVQY